MPEWLLIVLVTLLGLLQLVLVAIALMTLFMREVQWFDLWGRYHLVLLVTVLTYIEIEYNPTQDLPMLYLFAISLSASFCAMLIHRKIRG